MCVYHMLAVSVETRKMCLTLGTGVKGSYELGPLQEQQVLLTAEPLIYSQFIMIFFFFFEPGSLVTQAGPRFSV